MSFLGRGIILNNRAMKSGSLIWRTKKSSVSRYALMTLISGFDKGKKDFSWPGARTQHVGLTLLHFRQI